MQFGGVRAVDDLALAAPAGRITSLIGPNGAGKTTALNMLSGFYRAERGIVRARQRVAERPERMAIARAGVARTYQTSQLFGSLSVDDNVALAAQRGRLGHAARRHAPARARQPGARARRCSPSAAITGRLDARAADLAARRPAPGRDRARAGDDPDVLLLDEPAAGLSREDKERLAALLRRIADAGVACCWSSTTWRW